MFPGFGVRVQPQLGDLQHRGSTSQGRGSGGLIVIDNVFHVVRFEVEVGQQRADLKDSSMVECSALTRNWLVPARGDPRSGCSAVPTVGTSKVPQGAASVSWEFQTPRHEVFWSRNNLKGQHKIKYLVIMQYTAVANWEGPWSPW